MSKPKSCNYRSLVPDDVEDYVSYNPESGDLTWKVRPRHHFNTERGWKIFNSQYGGKTATSRHAKGYLRIYVGGTSYLAHRVIVAIMTGACPSELSVDHVNGIKSDNRWTNLRLVTGQENQMNMSIATNNTSGTVGVVWDKLRNKWSARIKFGGKHINLGRFNNIEDAICARKTAEKQYGFHKNHGRPSSLPAT